MVEANRKAGKSSSDVETKCEAASYRLVVVYIQTEQTKEERDAKAPKSFLGNCKVVWTNGQNVNVAPKEGQPQQKSNVDILQSMAEDNTPDLPF